MKNKEFVDNLKTKVVESIVNRRYLGLEYCVYLFKISEDIDLEKYKIQLIEFKETKNFNHVGNLPMPVKKNKQYFIDFEKYITWRYGLRGTPYLCSSLYNIIRDKDKKSVREYVPNYKFWLDNPAYCTGCKLGDMPAVIILIFEKPKDQDFDQELKNIYIPTLIKRVEDIFHKKNIFDKNYIDIASKLIDDGDFPNVKKCVEELKYNYDEAKYLMWLFYEFLIKNFKEFKNEIKTKDQILFVELTKDFEYNQKNLFRVPTYRDHFMHQCNVYILGIALIGVLYRKLSINLTKIASNAYKYRDQINIKEFGVIWFIASMYHDISYPIEKSGHWLNYFFSSYIYPENDCTKILDSEIKFSGLMTNLKYSRSLEEIGLYLHLLHNSKDDINYIDLRSPNDKLPKGCVFRNSFTYFIIDKKDHGALSALMIVDKFQKNKDINKYIFPAINAIYIHNHMWIKGNIQEVPCKTCNKDNCNVCKLLESYYAEYFKINYKNTLSNYENLFKISFEADPIGFLLIFCDALQDWGRQNTEPNKYTEESLINPSKIDKIEIKKNCLYINLKINKNLSNDIINKYFKMKKREFASVFSRLKFIKGYEIKVGIQKPKSKPTIFTIVS